MRRKIPTQLILLSVLACLAVSGWIYIYSCRDNGIMELQTITGDASCLSDKELNVQIITFPNDVSNMNNNRNESSFLLNACNLAIGFPSGPTPEKINYENVSSRFVSGMYFTSSSHINEDYYFTVDVPVGGTLKWANLPGVQIKDESAIIPDEYFTENSQTKTCGIGGPNILINIVEEDDILYFTIPNYFERPLLYYVSSYELKEPSGVTHTYEDKISYPLQFHAQSGIWAVNASSGASPENVVPFPITSNPDDPKVFGIYEVEEESAIVLLTVENKVDLYATVYDTKTKITHDPVLIFHSDSGDIEPSISRKNDTCPMGSIIVEVQNDDKEYYAVALGKNEMNGNIEPVCYDISQIISTGDEYDFNENTDESSILDGYSEVFYRGKEVWIISDIAKDSAAFLPGQLTLDSPNYPYSSQAAKHIRILAIKEGTILYEGILSIDLTIADLEAQVAQYAMYDSKGYLCVSRNSATQIELE